MGSSLSLLVSAFASSPRPSVAVPPHRGLGPYWTGCVGVILGSEMADVARCSAVAGSSVKYWFPVHAGWTCRRVGRG